MDNRQFVILITALILGSLLIVSATLWVGNETASATSARLPSSPPWVEEPGLQKASY